MRTVGIEMLKENLSEYVAMARSGERVIITDRGEEVAEIGPLSPELATVGGWQICVKKGVYHDGDPVVYFEQGTILPREVADRLGVTQYMSERTDIDGNRVLIIHRVRLRGEPSFGLVIAPEPGMVVGQDVADHYGAGKFFPPVRTQAGDSETNHPHFPAYIEIENMRSYPEILRDGRCLLVRQGGGPGHDGSVIAVAASNGWPRQAVARRSHPRETLPRYRVSA